MYREAYPQMTKSRQKQHNWGGKEAKVVLMVPQSKSEKTV